MRLLLLLLLLLLFKTHHHKATGRKTRLDVQNYGCNGNLLCNHGVAERNRISSLQSHEKALASSVIVVIRLPISCVSSVAISWHVPAVSMANGWKMYVVANLEYLSILFCAVLWAAAPGLVAVLPMYGTQHTLLLLTRSVNKKAVKELKLVRNCATRVFPVILFSSVPPTCIDISALLWRSCLFNVTRDSPIVQSRTERNQISDSPLFQCESLNLCTSLPKSAVICFTCFFV